MSAPCEFHPERRARCPFCPFFQKLRIIVDSFRDSFAGKTHIFPRFLQQISRSMCLVIGVTVLYTSKGKGCSNPNANNSAKGGMKTRHQMANAGGMTRQLAFNPTKVRTQILRHELLVGCISVVNVPIHFPPFNLQTQGGHL